MLPEHGGIQVQLIVGAPDEAGRWTVSVYSRPEGAHANGPRDEGHSWTRHASGVLVAREAVSAEQAMLEKRAQELAESAWPPVDAETVEVGDLYDQLADRGFAYGPAFQGLRAAWRRGEEVFAEVALPESQLVHAGEFGVHPALLDAALQAMALGLPAEQDGDGGVRLPFSWGGVRLHATGVSCMRVRLSPAGTDAVSLVLAEESGALIATVQSLVTRPVSRERLGGALAGNTESLFCVEWMTVPVEAPGREAAAERWVVLGGEETGLARMLRGAEVGVEVYEDFGSLGMALDAGTSVPGVVLVDCTIGGVWSRAWWGGCRWRVRCGDRDHACGCAPGAGVSAGVARE